MLGHAQADSAAPLTAANEGWDGLSEFIRLAKREVGVERVVPTATLPLSALTPEDAVLMLHPEKPLENESLIRFLADGGRVAILDESGTSDDFLARFKIKRRPPPAAPAHTLRGNPALPLAEPAITDNSKSAHPTVQNIRELATNHPASLVHPNLTPLFEFRTEGGTRCALAVTGVIQQGRLLVIADSSVFINLMLRYPGNRAFAAQAVRYLITRETSASGKIYVVSGAFRSSGAYGESTFLESMGERGTELLHRLKTIEAEGLPPELALALAALIWLLAVSVELKRGRHLERSLPSFAQPLLLAAESGLAARVEVLAAPSTTPLLALAELERAYTATLTRHLGISASAGFSEVVEGATQRLPLELGVQALAILRELRTQTARLGQKRPKGPSPPDLERIHRTVMNVIEELERTSAPS